jgi:hypothetical protein
MDRRSRWALGTVVVACLVLGGVYVAVAAMGPEDATNTDARPLATSVLDSSDILVRAVDPDNPRLNGRVFEVRDGKIVKRSGEDLTCERVYLAAGRGICMGVAPSGVEYEMTSFDSDLRPLETSALTGLPSRARVAADGRYGSMTVFVAGDSYLGNSSAFSTRAYILDMGSGETIGQLESFEVSKDGSRFDAPDFNFWGVTFAADPDRFYATLGTGGHHYLVEGSVGDRTVKVLRDGVECPSLSPDGSQIAFKSRIGESTRWRLRVLGLDDLQDHAVAESRSIDDQAEWLDGETLAYSDGLDVYTVPADGSGEAELLVRDATSPVRLDSELTPSEHRQ